MAVVDLDNVAVGPSDGPVLSSVSLSVEAGERFALLGASGSGKTLLLRLMADLARPRRGTVRVNGSVPRRSDPAVTMVFEEETIYEHLDVEGNLAFPLAGRDNDTRLRVMETARRFSITDYLDRPTTELSAGERRLVSTARALIREGVDLVLLDDPLKNLDAHLRHRLLQAVLEDPGLTVVFASRQPTEVMRWADRVAVLCGGTVAQVGAPVSVYRYPVSLEVAELIGELNRVPAAVDEGTVTVGGSRLSLPDGSALPDGTRVVLGLRPRDLAIADDTVPFGRRLAVTVGRVEPAGDKQRILFGLGSRPGVGFVAEIEATRKLGAGDRVDLSVDPVKVRLYEPRTGVVLGQGRHTQGDHGSDPRSS